ncbi:neutral zinc metallopeptidase, partial [Pseudescherichia sp.]
MRWQGRRESNNVEDRRNESGSPLGGRGLRLPRGKGGIILLVIVVIGGYYGVDLTGLLTGQPMSQPGTQQVATPQENEAAKFTRVIFATTEETWTQLFEKMGRTYQQP